MTTQNKITFRVIDAPTGAGKTTALIKMINAAQPAADNFNRFLVLTPLLQKYSGYAPIQTVGSL